MEVKQPEQIWRLIFEGNWPTAVAFVDEERIVAGNRDGQLFMWDLSKEPESDAEKADGPPSLAPVRQLVGHTNGITRLRAAPDRRLYSSSWDRTIRCWDLAASPTGTVEVVLDNRRRKEQAKKQRDESLLTAPGIEVETIAAKRTFDAHTAWVNALGLDAAGQRMISGDDAGLTILHDIAGEKELTRWEGHPLTGVVSACLSPDGKTAFVAEFRSSRGSFDRPPAQAKLFDAETGEERLDLIAIQIPGVEKRDTSYSYGRKWRKFVGRGFICSAFSPDGKLVAIGQGGETDTGKVHLIDTSTGKLEKTVSGHRYGVCDLLFSADGRYLVTSGRDTTVRIIHVPDGKQVAELSKPQGGQFKDWMHGVAVSPSQRLLAAADIAGRVHVWDLVKA